MAASLARPVRRFLHSSPSFRSAASATRLSPPRPPPSDDFDETSDPQAKYNQLNTFVGTVATTHNFTGGEKGQYTPPIAFERYSFLRPIDLNKDFEKGRPLGRRRSNLGLGREARYKDIFLQLGIDPRREADNEALLCGYMTRLGRIQPRIVTGLTQRSQRLVGKAIKRAKMMGVIPIFSNPRIRDPNQPRIVQPDSPTKERKDRTDYSVY